MRQYDATSAELLYNVILLQANFGRNSYYENQKTYIILIW